jgi:hypothetical protein
MCFVAIKYIQEVNNHAKNINNRENNEEQTKRFCALWLGIGPLLPVLSTFLIPDFITANVFILPL